MLIKITYIVQVTANTYVAVSSHKQQLQTEQLMKPKVQEISAKSWK